MIVEFAGVPGAGKTTIAEATAERLQTNNVSVTQPTTRINRENSALRRILRKSHFATQGTISDPKFGWQTGHLLRMCRQNELRMYVKNAFNMLYMRGIYEKSGPEQVTILDQGLLQGLWSIAYFSKKMPNTVERLLHFVCDVGEPMKYVFIDAPREEAQKRLADREHNRDHPSELEQENSSAQTVSYDAYRWIRKIAERMANETSNVSVSVLSNATEKDINRAAKRLSTGITEEI